MVMQDIILGAIIGAYIAGVLLCIPTFKLLYSMPPTFGNDEDLSWPHAAVLGLCWPWMVAAIVAIVLKECT